MEVLKTLLLQMFYVLIFPGFLFCFIFGMFLSGIDRKMAARMQRRIGPPITQPFYDFFKLVGKDHIIPRKASKKAFLLAPIFGLLSIVIISIFIPIFGYNFQKSTADIIVILYLITIPALSLVFGGSSSGSAYASIGISREMVTMLSYELPLVMILLAIGKKAGAAINGNVTFSLVDIGKYQSLYGIIISKWALIPAAIAFLMIIPAEVGTVPFDVAEAETEICEGPLVEYSGLYLGIYKLTQAVKMFIMGSLFIALFFGGSGFSNIFLNIILMIIGVIITIVISVSFVRSILGRLKVEQTLKFFWTVPTALSAISLILVYLKY
ncbi:MAG: NADH-quinone oxidoreductase subunit H [Bacillota bacterium]|nr:NADH-quinone oxidoreductase subunit H [Bacillota bacterium]